jgi:hypothetical protein
LQTECSYQRGTEDLERATASRDGDRRRWHEITRTHRAIRHATIPWVEIDPLAIPWTDCAIDREA